MSDDDSSLPDQAGGQQRAAGATGARVLDLTEEEVPASSSADEPPQERRYHPAKHREIIRGAVAFGLLLILAFIVIAAFVSYWFNWATVDEVESLLTYILTPLVGLVGAAAGFYFGTEIGRDR